MSLPTKELEIFAALEPILEEHCTATIVFDGPPMYRVPDAQYPFGVVHFEEARFARIAGGGAGSLGRNRVERAEGAIQELGGTARVEMRAGDVFVIETPGGGGYGKPG